MDMTRREDYLGLQVICFNCGYEINDVAYVDHFDYRKKYCYGCKETKSLHTISTMQVNKPSSDTFESKVMKTYLEAQSILLSKHADYGPLNIANAPGGALNGLRVRMHDKTARINHLIDNAKYKNPEHESLRDSFLDLANYAMIALLVIDNNWPTSDDTKTE